MEESKQDPEERLLDERTAETEKYMELLEDEVWDEALRSYNDILFTLLRYS